MTHEELRKRVKEELERYSLSWKHEPEDAERFIRLINQHVADVIGDMERTDVPWGDKKGIRNQLRSEQHERAGITTHTQTKGDTTD